MVDWRIQRRAGACSACQRSFDDGEGHFSALAWSDGELARDDHCRACWRDRDATGELFWWRTRHRENKDRRLRLNLEALEALFLKLEDNEDPTLRELRYVLCLLLMRKRRLKVRRIQRSAQGESFVVARPRRKEELVVWVYDFTPERMGELKVELVALFDGAEGDDAQGDAEDGAPSASDDRAARADEADAQAASPA